MTAVIPHQVAYASSGAAAESGDGHIERWLRCLRRRFTAWIHGRRGRTTPADHRIEARVSATGGYGSLIAEFSVGPRIL